MNDRVTRRHAEPMVFAPDSRPGADTHVYCKGCGLALEGQARRQGSRKAVAVMMCDECQALHGHALMPKPGAPSFCYRCGAADVIVMEKGYSPITHHLCPRCVPDRLARYLAGNFTAQQQSQDTQERTNPMSIEHLEPFERRVLAAVCQLAPDQPSGVSPADAMSLMAVDEPDGMSGIENGFAPAVNRLRQHGLLMSNPTGHLRPTSSGHVDAQLFPTDSSGA